MKNNLTVGHASFTPYNDIDIIAKVAELAQKRVQISDKKVDIKSTQPIKIKHPAR
jgi:hypothetical protein